MTYPLDLTESPSITELVNLAVFRRTQAGFRLLKRRRELLVGCIVVGSHCVLDHLNTFLAHRKTGSYV